MGTARVYDSVKTTDCHAEGQPSGTLAHGGSLPHQTLSPGSINFLKMLEYGMRKNDAVSTLERKC